MKRSVKFISTILCLLCFTLSCAAPTNLNKYPKRHIDRPYTLPNGITTWETWSYFEYLKNKDRASTKSFIFPFIWKQSLSNKLDLTWAPLPVKLQYQISKTDKNIYGASIGLSELGYSSVEKWIIGTAISGYQKHKFDNSLALASHISFNPVFRIKGKRKYNRMR